MSRKARRSNPNYPYPKKRKPKPNPMHKHKVNWHGWKDGEKYRGALKAAALREGE